ncbi:MAG: NAD(P)/FAD-dependent oxidoreductase [bacterium]|nr:NAD(P)/FAD-dependent oxidoreductase [bacterium]
MIKENKFDIAVVGAGPAGMIAAGVAAESGAKVVLIEKNKQLGKKLLLTGNGRCNLTNAEFNLPELVKNYNNGEFLFHAFSVFGPKEVINFFEKLGVKTKIEEGKRVFPKSDDSEKVLEALNKYLAKNKVNILFNSEVASVEMEGNPPSPKATAGRRKISKLILKDREITAEKYIFCTGGKSYPLTGSDGLGYKLAEKLGHTIVKPMPALSPIKLKEEWVKNLQGISLRDVKINVSKNGLPAGQAGKKQFSEKGEILFTHFGISGPAVLNISAKVGELLEKDGVKICLDLFPALTQEELLKKLEETSKRYPKKNIKNTLSDFVPEKLAEVLLDITGVNKNKIASNISRPERAIIVKTLKNLEVAAESILGFDEAKVTRGGVFLEEIDHKTMKSKIINNLFFAGEIIDVDGKTGGFNLQMCWSTGYIAGKSRE